MPPRRKQRGVGRGRYLRDKPTIGRPVVVAGAQKLQMTTRFDPDQFTEILRYSRRMRISFNEAVMTLVEFGLEALEEG